jgi:polyhydroxyalkanoate synthesis regulator phasin
MAGQKDGFRKLNEALTSTLKLTQQRGEELMKELLRAGEVQREQIRELVDELSKKSKSNVDAVREAVQREVSRQLGEHALPSREELQRIVEAVVEAAMGKAGRTHPTSAEESATPESDRAPSEERTSEKEQSEESVRPKDPSPASHVHATEGDEGAADAESLLHGDHLDAQSESDMKIDAEGSGPSKRSSAPRASRAKSATSTKSTPGPSTAAPRKRASKSTATSSNDQPSGESPPAEGSEPKE